MTALVQEALDYLGIFQHCPIKWIQLSSEEVKDRTQTKPVFICPPLPHPQRIVSKTSLGCPLSGHFTSCCRVALRSSGGTVSCLAECLPLAGVAGACCWAQSKAPTQESLGHLVWEPGTLCRQTRG